MINRTARSRTSGEYRFGEFMTPSSQDMESAVKPGRFTVDQSGHGIDTNMSPHLRVALFGLVLGERRRHD